jgi:mannose-6-phosphate isomerase-like protein (cupin superfamily)
MDERDGTRLTGSKVYGWDALPVVRRPNGGEGREIVSGVLATGETVALHASVQPVGAAPNPAHRIAHSEVILVSEGTLEFTHDGRTDRVGPGGVIFVALGTMHGLRNVGDVSARYFVVAIGGDVKA